MDANETHKGSPMNPYGFHSVLFRTGSVGRHQVTLCASAAVLAEVLILISGCELSTQLRKDMVQSFFGVGGSRAHVRQPPPSLG